VHLGNLAKMGRLCETFESVEAEWRNGWRINLGPNGSPNGVVCRAHLRATAERDFKEPAIGYQLYNASLIGIILYRGLDVKENIGTEVRSQESGDRSQKGEDRGEESGAEVRRQEGGGLGIWNFEWECVRGGGAGLNGLRG